MATEPPQPRKGAQSAEKTCVEMLSISTTSQVRVIGASMMFVAEVWPCCSNTPDRD